MTYVSRLVLPWREVTAEAQQLTCPPHDRLITEVDSVVLGTVQTIQGPCRRCGQ